MRRRHRLLTAVLVAGAFPVTPAAAAWRMPVEGEVVRPFDYRRSAPFQRGTHRNVAVEGRRGQRVRAARGGEVTHAGPVPERGIGVTVRCGSHVVTHIGLATTSVRAGARTRSGRTIGTLAGGHLILGARRVDDRWGYVDPLRLIGATVPVLGPAPLPRSTRWWIRDAPKRVPVRPTPAPSLREAPLGAWIGLGVTALAFAGGAPVAWRRRRRASVLTAPRVRA